ncbi:hypothetical protein ACFQ4Q_08640 [Lysobacter gummosus]|uniref:hypothetical protein n=1 Tax=Lysobacter gummosus TaxID=262324 RepID=UPI003631EE9F
MDRNHQAVGSWFVVSLMLALVGPLQAQTRAEPSASSEAARLTAEQRSASQKAAMVERQARVESRVEEMRRQVERLRNPTPEDVRQRVAEYQRNAPQREAQRREELKRALVDGPELDMREALAGQAQALFAAGDFAKLDALYDDVAQRSARTPSGLWKSSVVYAGLKGVAGEAGSAEQYQRSDAVLQKWLHDRPGSALARLLRAHLMFRRAWAFRGGDYSANVDKRNWQPFFEWLRQTKEYLDAEKVIASTRPEYYALTINLLKSQQKSPFSTFDEGLNKFPTYYEMYFSMLEYLLPKWNGSAEQIEHFASEAVARTQQSEGHGMYARIYWYASQTQFRDKLFLETEANWARMREGFDDVIARYPDQWNLQNYASFACDADDDETLAKLFERIREPSLDVAWRSRARYVTCGRRVGKFKD